MKRVFLVGFALVLCVPLVSLAQDDAAPSERESFEQSLAERRSQREERLEARNARACERQELRIDTIAERFEFVNERRETRLERIADIVSDAILRLQDNKRDTTDLEQALDTFNQNLVAVKAAQADLESQVELLSTSACQDDAAEFRQQLQTARTALRSVREADRAAVRTVRQDVISALQDTQAADDQAGDNSTGEVENE